MALNMLALLFCAAPLTIVVLASGHVQQFGSGESPNGRGNVNRNGQPPLMATGTRTAEPQKAIARLTNSATVQGVVVFTQIAGLSSVRVTGNVTGLAPNSAHGFHIHRDGDIASGCAAAGPHYNPRGTDHGAPTDQDSVRHDGDLGNIFADQSGKVNLDATFDFIHLESVLGRAIVVHEKMDDLGQGGAVDSKTTGNAGGRLACGVIVIAV